MNIKNKPLLLIGICISFLFFAGCNNDDDDDDTNPNAEFPTVISTDPENNETAIERNAVISVKFDEPMDPLTITTGTFILKQGSANVAGVVVYADLTATFTPTEILEPGVLYTATVSTSAENTAGSGLESNVEWSFSTGGTLSSLTPITLGAASDYVILAKTAISSSTTSAVTGDLGLSPAATSYVTGFDLINGTGFATSAQVTGNIYAADMAVPTPINLTTAVNNMVTAYTDAAGRPSPDFIELSTGNLGGRTLIPGLYKWTNTVTIPSDMTISGGADDVWIFQIAGDLTMSSAINMTLSGGAQTKNIFWQVAGEVVVGTTAHFEGVIMSMTSITFQTGSTINGRALAQTAVILDASVVTEPQD